jgi:Nif-specific regulatory protein
MELTLEKAIRQRDLYRQLLEVGLDDDLELFLDKALTLFIEVTGARRGYIELRDPRSAAEGPSFSLVRGLADDTLLPGGFSRSVINETLLTGQTVVTASAHADARFAASLSVRMSRLEAVLCAPIGKSPVLGVVYLQDRREVGPFTDEDRTQAEIFARHLAGFADRVLSKHAAEHESDPTQALRKTLRLETFVGKSLALTKVFQQLSLVAPLKIGVLLTGDSGTGKTQVAHAIHDNGPQRAGPFVELNCAAIPEDLLENELFGSERGAHSTAQKRSVGKVEAAEGGTLFLDEVGELSLRAQAKLLQLLQSGDYYSLGSSTPRSAHVRVVAATNADLSEAVREKRFREDLFYRLNVFPIRLPSISERREDIQPLATYFCARTCEQNSFPVMELSAGAVLALENADWPGNVRELQHTVEAGVIRARGEASALVERKHLFPSQPAPDGRGGTLSFHAATREFQQRLLSETLERQGWNVTAAARALELTRAHVYNLMATFQIKRPPTLRE